MTKLPSTVRPGDPRIRVQGFIDPDTAYTLFEQHYPMYGTVSRVIALILKALAQHVTEHCNPNDPLGAREQNLADLLSRVSFGHTPRGGHLGDGHEQTQASPSSDQGTQDERD